MTRVLPRARLHSSELLRFLASQGLVDATADMGDVGQRLGDWLNFRQAIALQGFIGTVDDPDAPQAAPSARVDADVLRRRFAEVRLALEQEAQQLLGGDLLNEPGLEAWRQESIAALEAMPEVTLLPRTTAFGYHDHDFVTLAERRADHLPPAEQPVTVIVLPPALWK